MLSKIRKQKLEQNIWKFYLYRVFCSFFFAAPIWVLFLMDNGLSMIQIMILESIYTAIIMLAVVPGGIVADYIGRKKVLIFSTLCFVLGFVFYASGHSFIQFLIGECIFAVSAAAWMASGTPFFYDTLRELGKEGSFKKKYGKVIGIESIVWGIAALVGGYIATFSLRLPFWVTIVPVTIALLFSFSFTETQEYKHGEKKYLAHLKEAVSFTAKHPKVRFFIIYAAVLIGVLYTVAMLYQPYFKSLGIPLVGFGAIYAAMSGAVALGARYAHKIEEKLGEKKLLLILPLLLILSYIGMSRTVIMIGVLFPFLAFFVAGVFDPVINDYIHKHVESHHRATVTSLGVLVRMGFTAALAPFLGYIFDVYTLQAAFTVSAAILIINIFILSLMYAIGWSRLRDGQKEVI